MPKKLKKIYFKMGGSEDSFFYKIVHQFLGKWYAKKTVDYRHSHFVKHGMEALIAFKAACDEAGVKFAVEFGTLLGAYRNKSFIPFDDDLDITVMADDYSYSFENILLKYGFFKYRIHYYSMKQEDDNWNKELTIIAFSYKGLNLDIYLSHPLKDGKRAIRIPVGAAQNGKFTIHEWIHSCDGLHKVNINGLELNSFSDPKQELTEIYGDDFMTPKKNSHADKFNHKVYDLSDCYGYGYSLPYAEQMKFK